MPYDKQHKIVYDPREPRGLTDIPGFEGRYAFCTNSRKVWSMLRRVPHVWNGSTSLRRIGGQWLKESFTPKGSSCFVMRDYGVHNKIATVVIEGMIRTGLNHRDYKALPLAKRKAAQYELDPCPFCGDTPLMVPENPARAADLPFARIMCRNDDCPARPDVLDGFLIEDHASMAESRQSAVERWNHRG